MKTAIFALSAFALAASAHGAISLTGGTYTENFDGLQTTATLASATGVQTTLSSIGWDVARAAGTSATAMPYTTEAGTGNSGGIRNVGQTTGALDRALGSLASGSNAPVFGVAFTNNTGDIIDGFVLVFDAEQYRSSTVQQNVLTFAWGTSTGGATASNYLTSPSLTNLVDGNITGNAPVSGSNGALYTLLNDDQTVLVTGISVGVGETIFLRWTDADNTGNDATLAINNVRFTPSVVPTPATVALLALGGLVGARRRRA